MEKVPDVLGGGLAQCGEAIAELGAQVFLQLSLELLGASCQHLQLLTDLMRDNETSSTLVILYISTTPRVL